MINNFFVDSMLEKIGRMKVIGPQLIYQSLELTLSTKYQIEEHLPF